MKKKAKAKRKIRISSGRLYRLSLKIAPEYATLRNIHHSAVNAYWSARRASLDAWEKAEGSVLWAKAQEAKQSLNEAIVRASAWDRCPKGT